MNFIIIFLLLFSIQTSMMMSTNGILTQAENAKVELAMSTVLENVQTATLAEISTFLQTNTLSEPSVLAEYMRNKMSDSTSAFTKSLPEGYMVSGATLEGNIVKYTVVVDGVTYSAEFNAETQTTTVD